MEDLSRFTGPVRASSRLAAYRAGLNGQSAAEIGIAAALARATGNQAPLAARTVPTARTVATAKRNATTSATQDRVKIVAAAVERDPALAGKAGEAIAMLADPELAGLTGAAVVKSLKAGVTVSPPAPAASKASTPAIATVKTTKRSDALGGGDKPTTASSNAWANVIARMNGNRPQPIAGKTAGDHAWSNAIAKLNRLNGF